MIKLSVVIVAYKNLDCLAECLASIPDLSWLEVIVVNNTHQNRGFGAGCNLGASISRGEFLLFVNPDCVVNRELLVGLKNMLETDASIGMVAPALADSLGEKVLSVSQQPTKTNAWVVYSILNKILNRSRMVRQHWFDGTPPEVTADVGIVSGALFGMRAKVFRKLHGFDQNFFLYWEEVDLAKRCLQQKLRIVYEPKFVAIHRGALSTLHHKTVTMNWFRESRYYFFKKYFGVIYASLLEGWFTIGEHWPLVITLGLLSLTGSAATVVLTVMVYNEMLTAGRFLAAMAGAVVGVLAMPWGLWGVGVGLGWITLDIVVKEPRLRKLYLIGVIILCLAL